MQFYTRRDLGDGFAMTSGGKRISDMGGKITGHAPYQVRDKGGVGYIRLFPLFFICLYVCKIMCKNLKFSRFIVNCMRFKIKFTKSSNHCGSKRNPL